MSLRFLLVLITIALCVTSLSAQSPRAGSSPGDASERGNPLDLPPGDPLLEAQKKMVIRAEEKEHAELIERGEEVARLSEELNKSFQQTGGLGANYAERLNQIEKNVKKIRRTLGGGDDEESDEARPKSLGEAVSRLTELIQNLQRDLKESTRYTVSASSIDDANTILDLIAFIRKSRR
jgi:hypothetical protein